jgi:hypothetical protein
MPEEFHHSINQEEIDIAISEIPRAQQVFTFQTSLRNVWGRIFLMQQKEQDNPNCPSCGSFEKSSHVWVCTDQIFGIRH